MRPAPILFFVFLVVLAGACKQGEGDRCEVDSDCKSGLTCETFGTGTGGLCTSRPGGTVRPPDAVAPPPASDAVARDSPPRDSPPDVGPEAAASDAATEQP